MNDRTQGVLPVIDEPQEGASVFVTTGGPWIIDKEDADLFCGRCRAHIIRGASIAYFPPQAAQIVVVCHSCAANNIVPRGE
jgi:hypothetical protein